MKGSEVRNGNILAVSSVCNIIKSSLGPKGLDKMIVDEVGEVLISNDGATILKNLEIQHPAAKILVELSSLQDKEVGDGTTSVVLIASELLIKANQLISKGIHPSQIIQGYKIALKQAVKYLQTKLSIDIKKLGHTIIQNIVTTSMQSKLIQGNERFFSSMICECIKQCNMNNKVNLANISYIKVHGQSVHSSQLFPGIILRASRVSQQMSTQIDNPKVACLDFNLNKFRLGMGQHILVSDPNNLEKIRAKEVEVLKNRLQLMINAGANVFFTTMAIDDIAANIILNNNGIGIRRVPKNVLRKIAKSTNATIVKVMANPDGNEYFESSWLGTASKIYEECLSDIDHIFIQSSAMQQVCTFILRGPNEYFLDEVERSINDCLQAVKRSVESGQVVVGAGACEIALNIYLERFADTLQSKEQYAVMEFAESLLVIPKQLCINAVQDSMELISKLGAVHQANQLNPNVEKYQNLMYWGLDLESGKIKNCLDSGVIEPLESKIKSLKFAVEVAITILRIDDLIKIEPEKE